MTIFDLILASEIVSYWELLTRDRAPYFGAELWDEQQKLGLKIEWIKGSNGTPVVLKPSAYDVAAIPRKRIGFETFEARLPFFKESKYIDEELRQELNMVLESGNSAYVDAILNRIFADEVDLLEGAAAQRERMRMMALTTGQIAIEANGQTYFYDYGVPAGHKVTVGTSWSDPSATIIEDIKAGIDKILEDTGVTVTRAVCGSKVLGYMRKNNELKASLNVMSNGQGYVSDSRIKTYIQDELGIEIVANDARYIDEGGAKIRYVDDDVLVLFPDGKLGTMWFGTTPEQSDLMAGNSANVAITDVGVAVTTTQKTDPVQVMTKVSQICLPDFPTADQIYIMDLTAE